MVVNTCQYSPSLTMWTLWLSSPHVGEITGGDGAWCPTPNPGSNMIQPGSPRWDPPPRPWANQVPESSTPGDVATWAAPAAAPVLVDSPVGDSLGLKVWYEFISDLWLMTCLMDTYSILRYLSYLWILFWYLSHWEPISRHELSSWGVLARRPSRWYTSSHESHL